ncbi:MAG: zonular occludens toxin domain-containing protein, partial [Actinomycetota bacterium]
PGMGKTYSLVRLAYKLINEGRNIYSNFHIDFSSMPLKEGHGEVFYWENINDIIPIKSGEIIIDECQIYMNSRNWKNLPPSVQYKLQQHRKQGLNIHGAVQNVKRIDSVARELVNSIFECKRKLGKLFVVKEFDIEDIDKEKRSSYSTQLYWLDKKLASCYDTLQEIRQNISY